MLFFFIRTEEMAFLFVIILIYMGVEVGMGEVFGFITL